MLFHFNNTSNSDKVNTSLTESESETESLKEQSQRKDLVIQKAGKCKSLLIVETIWKACNHCCLIIINLHHLILIKVSD